MTRGVVRRLGQALLQTGDRPERTAAAFAVGVLIGFSPLLGFQTVIGIVVAVVFRLNRLAVLAGVYANLPWFMGPYYAAATALGALLLGHPIPPDLAMRIDVIMGLPGWRAQLEALAALLRPFFLPYLLGSTLCGLLLGGLAYPPALAFVRRRHQPGVDSPDFRQGS